jgi:hypothetical protein
MATVQQVDALVLVATESDYVSLWCLRFVLSITLGGQTQLFYLAWLTYVCLTGFRSSLLTVAEGPISDGIR